MLREIPSKDASVFSIDENLKTPKFLQVAHGIIAKIETGIYRPGDRLPSIVETSTDCYLARGTVEKAYESLLKSGHITSLYRRGFFISGGKTRKKVLFLTGRINESVREIFNVTSDLLGKDYKVDIYSCEYQREYLYDCIESHAGNYHHYIFMPHHFSDSEDLKTVMSKIPAERLILLGGSYPSSPRACISVSFSCGEQLRTVLEENAALFRQYHTLNFVTTDREYIPADWYRVFISFAEKYGLKAQVMDSSDEMPVRKGTAYLLFDDEDLVHVIRQTEQKQFLLGTDVGLVTFNDASLKSLVAGGISVIKTDVSGIVRSLVDTIGQRNKMPVHIPMQFIQRGSL